MSDPNVHEPAWELEFPDAGLKGARVGAAAGAERLGAAVYELDTGGAVSPYHTHLANEELLVVLAGRPSVRTPEGVRRLEPGAVVSFSAGAAGAHRVFNASDEPARVLLVSTQVFPDLAEHVDTGTWLAIEGSGQGRLYPAGAEGDVGELMTKAMLVGAERDAAGG